MKRLFVIAVLFSCFVFGAGAQERLEPVSEPYDFEILYRSALDKILWKNMPSDVPFSFEICPSFTPESALSYDPQQGIFIYVKADRNIWDAGRIYNGSVSRFGLMRVEVREYSCPVSSDVARHFLELFQIAIESAEKQDIMGDDGETYQLWTNGQTKTATCWSPNEDGSNCNRLVKLLYALSAYTQEKDSEGIEALIPEADSLAESFRKITPDPQTQNKESAPGYYDDSADNNSCPSS